MTPSTEFSFFTAVCWIDVFLLNYLPWSPRYLSLLVIDSVSPMVVHGCVSHGCCLALMCVILHLLTLKLPFGCPFARLGRGSLGAVYNLLWRQSSLVSSANLVTLLCSESYECIFLLLGTIFWSGQWLYNSKNSWLSVIIWINFSLCSGIKSIYLQAPPGTKPMAFPSRIWASLGMSSIRHLHKTYMSLGILRWPPQMI